MSNNIKAKWNVADIPDQSGRIVIVTGANSGLGLETTRALVAKNAKVIMACRTLSKAVPVADQIRRAQPKADIDVMQLDVAKLHSVKDFAKSFIGRYGKLDILINNAGVMGCPTRETTTDGFEMQFGTNHLGAFALTGRLMPALQAAAAARVIAVSSIAHRNTDGMNLDDPNLEQGYKPFDAYAKSKLANLLFVRELDRRLRAANIDMLAASGHPGYSASNIGTASNPNNNPIKALFFKMGNWVAMPTTKGMLSILCAATDPSIEGGDFIGPQGLLGFYGWPAKSTPKPTATDDATAKRLWEISADLTGVHYLD